MYLSVYVVALETNIVFVLRHFYNLGLGLKKINGMCILFF
jgi:hypothetical protein